MTPGMIWHWPEQQNANSGVNVLNPKFNFWGIYSLNPHRLAEGYRIFLIELTRVLFEACLRLFRRPWEGSVQRPTQIKSKIATKQCLTIQ
jgi:hypothetical protein